MPALLLLALFLAGCAMPQRKPDWALSWSDEFDGPDGSAPDRSKWTIEVSTTSPPNAELQCYTDGSDNIRVEGGMLVITALREDYDCPDKQRRLYTSGRMDTKGKFAQKHGRFEARLRVPEGQGIWPAFWMLGDDIDKVDWPDCGEIDVMEHIGREPHKFYGTIHGPGYYAEKGPSANVSVEKPASEEFHVLAVEWAPERIDFFLDGKKYATRTPADIPPEKKWVYEHPFFIIVNLAVGGSWPGNPDATTAFPQKFLVDYVRVYSRKP